MSDEPEVTPDMIAAGFDAYWAVRRFPHDDLFDAEIATRVYRAMQAAAVSRPLKQQELVTPTLVEAAIGKVRQ